MKKPPSRRPARTNFSSGPCAKPPTWSPSIFSGETLGRSHRSKPLKAMLRAVIEQSREILEIPDTYRIGIVPASDTGAVEMALWSLLGERGVEVLAWESFGRDWLADVTEQLSLEANLHVADYGQLPDLARIDFSNDVVFTWNGTTSGVRVPDGEFIPASRSGLTICDATSAAFAMRLPWDKLDVTTWSWQKVLGGEAAHGMIALSPRAVERLESWTPPWPIPKVFQLTRNGRLVEGIFEGVTINTPSMLCVQDCLHSLGWIKSEGGLQAMIDRVEANAAVVDNFVAGRDWIAHLAANSRIRSTTSLCLVLNDPAVPDPDRASIAKSMVSRLEAEGVAHDIGSYRSAPPGLRIWCGATVEEAELRDLMNWVEWAYLEEAADKAAESGLHERAVA